MEVSLKKRIASHGFNWPHKEISRAVSFLINHGGKVTGSLFSPQCFPSSMATRRLEALIDCDFKMDVSKPKLLERLKDIIERNYDEPIKASVQPIEYLDYLASEQELEEEQNDGKLDVVFIDDKEDQRGLKKICNDKLKTTYACLYF